MSILKFPSLIMWYMRWNTKVKDKVVVEMGCSSFSSFVASRVSLCISVCISCEMISKKEDTLKVFTGRKMKAINI